MKKVFLLMAFLMSISIAGWSQGIKAPKLVITPADTIANDSLVVTEVYVMDWWQWGYIEFTNMSSKPINLGNYYLY